MSLFCPDCKKLQTENAELKARWEKLEEWVDENEWEKDQFSIEPRMMQSVVKYTKIREKMHELEKEKVK